MKTLSLLLIALSATACTTEDTDDAELFDLDTEAAIDEGKADGLGPITRLERATAAEVTSYVVATRGPQLRACFAAWKAKTGSSATRISMTFIDAFSQVDNATCPWWMGLEVEYLVRGILTEDGVTSLSPSQLIARMPAWVRPQLDAGVVDGYVSTREVDGEWYQEVVDTQDQNAKARERNPSGVDLAAVRAAWDKVRDNTTLDRAYLNPVTFPAGALDGPNTFRYLRAAFPLRSLSLVSTGYQAIDDMAQAGEGPDGDPDFTPIRTAFRRASIKKRFYFARGGDWSSNVLIVIDQHGQAYGMQMGYSE